MQIITRPVAQPQRADAGVGHARRRAFAPQRAGAQAVVLGEGGVEAAQAGKAAHQRDLRDRQIGVGQQLLGREQAARLQVLQGRHTELRLEDAPQVAVAHAQARRQPRHAGRLGAGAFRVVQPLRGLARQHRAGVLRGPDQRLWRQFGPAAQAGPEAGGFGLRRVAEETAVLAPRRAHLADRAAVDAGGGDAGEEAPVEARVVRRQRAVAGIGAQRQGVFGHAAMVAARRRWTGRFRTC